MLNNQAILNRRLGEYDRALELYRDSLEISEALGNQAGTAAPLNNMGVLLYNRGDFRGALEHYARALALLPPGDDLVADTLLNIGLVHHSQGDLELAESYIRRSLAVSRELGVVNDLADTYLRLGEVLLAQERREEALQELARAEQEATRVGDPLTLGELQLLRGDVALRAGRTGEALEIFVLALQRARAVGAVENVGQALSRLTRARLAAGQPEEARAAAAEATALLGELHNLELLWPAQTALGQALATLGRKAEARAACEAAIRTIEELRESLAGDEAQRQGFLESRLEPYHALVELLLAEGRGAEALEASERARGRTLSDVLLRGRLRMDRHRTAAERDEERQLEHGLAELHARRAAAEGPPARAEAEQALAALRARMRDFQARAFASHPELRLAKGGTPPAGLAEAALALDPRTALLAYTVTSRGTHLFVVTVPEPSGPARLQTFTLPAAAPELARRVGDLRRRLAARDLDFGAAGRPLFDLLVAPATAALARSTRLVVVPDGPLWELPFEALPGLRSGVLLEDLAISYAPSLTALAVLRRAGPRPPATGPALLAFGNPRLPAGADLPRLPEAERQVLALAALYPLGASRVRVGAQAGEGAFKQQAGSARVLHLATHARLEDASPLFSHLYLAADGPGEDGRLEARELLDMDLGAGLVVLSACETGRGRVGAGEGLIGLSWAVAVAGTPNVVASHWSVESASTTQLMLAFHRQLQPARAGGTTDLAGALRAAALEVRRDPRYRHPFYWAGFFVLGAGRV